MASRCVSIGFLFAFARENNNNKISEEEGNEDVVLKSNEKKGNHTEIKPKTENQNLSTNINVNKTSGSIKNYNESEKDQKTNKEVINEDNQSFRNQEEEELIPISTPLQRININSSIDEHENTEIQVTNQNTVETSSDNANFNLSVPALALLPTKFRKLIWIKRGDFVIVTPTSNDISNAVGSVNKCGYDVKTVLYKDQVKYLKSKELWPVFFMNEKPCGASQNMKRLSGCRGEVRNTYIHKLMFLSDKTKSQVSFPKS